MNEMKKGRAIPLCAPLSAAQGESSAKCRISAGAPVGVGDIGEEASVKKFTGPAVSI